VVRYDIYIYMSLGFKRLITNGLRESSYVLLHSNSRTCGKSRSTCQDGRCPVWNLNMRQDFKFYSTKFREHKVRTAVSYFMEPFLHSSNGRQGNYKVKFAPPNVTGCTSGGYLPNTRNCGQNRRKTPPTKQDREVLTTNIFHLGGTASNLSQTIWYTN